MGYPLRVCGRNVVGCGSEVLSLIRIKKGRRLNIYFNEGSAKPNNQVKSATRPLYLYTRFT